MSRSRKQRAIGAALLAIALAATACTPDGEAPATQVTAASLTVAVYGTPGLISAYRAIATSYTTANPQVHIAIQGYGSATEEATAVSKQRAAGNAPDLFLSPETDVDRLVDQGEIQPLSDLLTAQQLDFGDQYDRTGLEAFSREAALQCMPIDRSPVVVYLNSRLVDLAQVPAAGAPPLGPNTGWTWADFARAVELGAADGHAGLAVEPTLSQVGALIFGAGGSIVDTPESPTRLTLENNATAAVLSSLLSLSSTPGHVVSPSDLAKQDALARFRAGQVAMILGDRSLVPTLRSTPGLDFDVMPIPQAAKPGTTGTADGMCLSVGTKAPAAAADFVHSLVSAQSMTTLAKTGAVVPTNLAVATSADFLDPGDQPKNSRVFVDQIPNIKELPQGSEWLPVGNAIEAFLAQLLSSGTVPSDQDVADQIHALVTRVAPLMAAVSAPSASP